ncbi:hypothetical protein [Nonomuraea sp. NPDC050310]|uniref:hypothetical protein n=1 Tax=unclassified Nonomuraea TaxID=2593643 RepID=UPI0033F39BB4
MGLVVGATFGLVFVLVNAGEPLPFWLATALQILAIVGYLAMFVLGQLGLKKHGRPEADPAGRQSYGKGFWITVVIEFALIFGGLYARAQTDLPPETNVAWIALVVGLHFVVFWKIGWDFVIAIPGFILTALGLIGLVMVFTPALAWTPIVSGVLAGVVLLGGTLSAVADHYRTGR